MSILDKISGRLVYRAGLVLCGVVIAVFFRSRLGMALAGLVAVHALSSTTLFKGVDRVLSHFAKAPAWPEYVSLAVAGIAAANHGGRGAAAFIAAVATVGVGRLFDILY